MTSPKSSGGKRILRTLLVDNYDSFTYNLFQLIAQVNGVEPTVIKNDDPLWSSINFDDFDAVVISPGPGHPATPSDVGYSVDVLKKANLPVLGVCLGHQLIGHFYGAKVDYAPNGVMHGRLSEVFHDGTGVFAGIPSPFNVVRYHSLVADSLPPDLLPVAHTEDQVLMGLAHATKPVWGVQFHPESICTEYGEIILANFRDLVTKWAADNGRQLHTTPLVLREEVSVVAPAPEHKVAWRELGYWLDSALVFEQLYGESNPAFWLDSARTIPGLSRFSYMGDVLGPGAEALAYDTETQTIRRTLGDVTVELQESIFSHVEQTLAKRSVIKSELPLSFDLGYVGYLGYELKNECGATAPHSSPQPDAYLMLADRMIAFDHETETIYLVALDDEHSGPWFDETEVSLERIRARGVTATGPAEDYIGATISPALRHSEDEYKQLIADCHHEIHEGESYEICLTNMIHAQPLADPLATYMTLRHSNPAPFAAYLRFPDFSVLSSSPERFLKVDVGGRIEAKPIKGTIRRGTNAADDERMKSELRNEKDQAENLMIVDLLRNDLGVVAEVGSVHVPKIFDIESYATVHQLVSTVAGQLREDRSPVACVKAAFPGGSMTGAPKIRTLDIIDRLEDGYRGVYSGAIGYFSLSGVTDWSIVIRTMVATAEETTIGVGGAITALSDAQGEFDETMLKAKALLHAIAISEFSGSRLASA